MNNPNPRPCDYITVDLTELEALKLIIGLAQACDRDLFHTVHDPRNAFEEMIRRVVLRVRKKFSESDRFWLLQYVGAWKELITASKQLEAARRITDFTDEELSAEIARRGFRSDRREVING
jgi:hypothetical protein